VYIDISRFGFYYASLPVQ